MLFLQVATQFIKGSIKKVLSRPLVSKHTLAHDSYLCKKYKDSETRAFPTKRIQGVGNFVGSVIETGGTISFTEAYECPKECRPPDHQDWIYC